MKLFIVLFLAVTTLTTLTLKSQADTKKAKAKRKIANADNVIFDTTLLALNKSSALKNSKTMANNFSKSTSYECSDLVENTELKSIEPVSNKGFRFNGTRMCFDQAGPGVVEIQYEGFIKDSEIEEIKIKLVQNSKN